MRTSLYSATSATLQLGIDKMLISALHSTLVTSSESRRRFLLECLAEIRLKPVSEAVGNIFLQVLEENPSGHLGVEPGTRGDVSSSLSFYYYSFFSPLPRPSPPYLIMLSVVIALQFRPV